MSWSPTDLVADADLRDYENDLLDNFGQTSWAAKRTKALEDWLFPILRGRGYDPYKLRVRADPKAVQSYTGSVYTDVSGAARSPTSDDLNLATIFTSPSTDAIYVGSDRPFRGLFWRLADFVSAVTAKQTMTYWNGIWESLAIEDGTMQVDGKTFSGGGSVTWTLPVDWVGRYLNATVGPYYWVRIMVNATPTGAKASQVGTIHASALRAPATFRTLQLIFQEAPTGQEGPWRDKAEFYGQQADAALQRAMIFVAEEFDTDVSGQVGEVERAQTAADLGATTARLERA